jgi:hypothetical protein
LSRNIAFGVCAAAAVVTALVLGFIEGGSPGLQRMANADIARSRNLDSIAGAVRLYDEVHHRLPDHLEDVKVNDISLRLRDPETNTPYEYQRLDERHYELCAVFATDASADPPFLTHAHRAGRQCFTFPP